MYYVLPHFAPLHAEEHLGFLFTIPLGNVFTIPLGNMFVIYMSAPVRQSSAQAEAE